MKNNSTACTHVAGPDLSVVAVSPPENLGGDFSQAHNESRSEGARKIEQSIAYMMDHLNQPLQVARLAHAAHISPSHFFVLFKRWAGCSPIEYFIRLRMQRAGRLLATTAMSVKEIAADLGYDDPFYFSRLFKSIHGVAPTEYRMTMERLAQPDRHGEIVGLHQAGDLQPVSLSEEMDSHTEKENIPSKHNGMAPAAPGIYVLK